MNATVEQLAPVEQQATAGWVVAALYQFKEVQDPADLQPALRRQYRRVAGAAPGQ